MKIGFIGAGKMGLPIAWNIANALDTTILVHDSRPLTLPEHVDAARFAFAPQLDDLHECTVVVLCLPDSHVVASVVEGQGERPGLINILKQGSTIVDCGSSVPAETRRLSAALATNGIALHDAPVSGGLARAWAGELTVMTGGVSDDNPVLSVIHSFASKVVRLDRIADGHVMKAANNYLLAANIISFSEALRFARSAGISFEKFGEVVNSSSGASYVSANKLDTVRRDDDSVSFTTALIAKDVRNFIESCRNEGLDMPLMPEVLAVWEQTIAQLGGDVDSMKIFHTIARASHA